MHDPHHDVFPRGGPSTGSQQSATAESLTQRYLRIRQLSSQLCQPLSAEDCAIQSMPDVSPIRWHLAHTTWFFETFVLVPSIPDYRPFCEAYGYLFNSYYNQVGAPFPRGQRGLLSRPTLDEVWAYRVAIDERILQCLAERDRPDFDEIGRVIDLGLQHEQQHQELMLTDIKHVFSCNPLYPAYHSRWEASPSAPTPLRWLACPRQLSWFGHAGSSFAYDNESPRHERLVLPYSLASRLITNAEYLDFVADGGYQRPELWLSLGWQHVQQERWTAPLYWQRLGEQWHEFTLAGLQPLDLSRPVCHISYFEADAFARWRQARLPTEFEWEFAARSREVLGNFVESGQLHPEAAVGESMPQQVWGDVWEWTASSYSAYPGYRPDEGALGEYNGKFMCNQFVLRGGSCASSRDHLRPTYRNFFPPEARWQFAGVRLASDDVDVASNEIQQP